MTADALARRVSMALLCGCALLVGLTLVGVGRASADRTGVTGYLQGEPVDLPSEWFSGTGRGDTLFVFLRSDCAASQAFVAALSELRSALPVGVALRAVVSDEVPDREIAFAETAGFGRASILTVDFSSLRLRVVPSLVLVGSTGVVKMERLGAGDGRVDALATLPRVALGS